jgi:hypothetical protein
MALRARVAAYSRRSGLCSVRDLTNATGFAVSVISKMRSGLESASRLLIVLVIMTMQLGRINAFNEMCAGFKVK